MKKTARIFAAVMCVVLMAMSLTGCTVRVNVKLNNSGSNSGSGSVAVDATTPAPTAPATTVPATPTTVPPATTGGDSSQDSKPAEDTQPAASAELSSSSSVAEIVAEYAKVYNTTKAAGTFLGHDSMTCESVMIEGKEQGLVKSAADKFMSANGTSMPLPPYSDDNASNECLITADDVESATYTDNGDGTATIKIVPKEAVNSKKFSDPQGKMFNVMEDVAEGIKDVSVVTWAEGDANSNVTLTTKEGYAEVTYTKDTKMMTKADYVLVTYADVQHCNVLIFKDKSGSAKFVYTMSYPG